MNNDSKIYWSFETCFVLNKLGFKPDRQTSRLESLATGTMSTGEWHKIQDFKDCSWKIGVAEVDRNYEAV